MNKVKEVKGVTERISVLKEEIEKGTKLLLIQVYYAPTQQADLEVGEHSTKDSKTYFMQKRCIIIFLRMI